ncbi:MAG: CpaD family pilus assembly lipoprotein [Bdellovibrionales bacterium]
MKRAVLALLPLLLLTACFGGDDAGKPVTESRGYTIDVVRQPDGALRAEAPDCVPWDDGTVPNLTNDPLPQLGCASQHNLAKQIVNPADLVRDQLPARDLAKGDGETLSTGNRRFHENKTYAPATDWSTAGTTQ